MVRVVVQAMSSQNQSSILLQGLFADIALEVDVRAKGKLLFHFSILNLFAIGH